MKIFDLQQRSTWVEQSVLFILGIAGLVFSWMTTSIPMAILSGLAILLSFMPGEAPSK
ncbi:hypothetical protein KKG22_00035 [Patescibacteria group bacterium]|nr:hypothetical protein [Patescibacteria group bacterium]MBU1721379.1 hypothetical protein [Patescibacteria group bacterium]MBU1900912.1 hypothetical protein [Patescibacteria group bacterium]